jgi:Zn-dependent protease
MSGVLLYLALLIPAMVIHEVAHGFVAHLLGDETAKNEGRLTLNPFKHIDRYGSIVVPAVLAIGQMSTIGHVQFLYGWAKPVPINPLNLQIKGRKNPRRLMAIVAFAGPASNFILALAGGLFWHAGIGQDYVLYFIYINLVIGIFNLIPLPPMDGGRIAVGVLPLPLARLLARTERLGIGLVLLVLFILPLVMQQFGVRFEPFQDAMGAILPYAGHIILLLTGNGFGN